MPPRSATFSLSLGGESHKIFCYDMKKTRATFPEHGPSVRRTLEKLEIEDGERRAPFREWLSRLFRRKDRPGRSHPKR